MGEDVRVKFLFLSSIRSEESEEEGAKKSGWGEKEDARKVPREMEGVGRGVGSEEVESGQERERFQRLKRRFRISSRGQRRRIRRTLCVLRESVPGRSCRGGAGRRERRGRGRGGWAQLQR